MARILYGAPESEREKENSLVARLRNRKEVAYSRKDKAIAYVRETNQVAYLNDFLGFAFELARCKNSLLLPRKYDLIIYDTKVYGEDWSPQIRAENFKFTITPFLQKKEIPIIVLADEQIQKDIEDWIKKQAFHYVAQPYSVDEVVAKVDFLLPKPRRKKE